MNEDKTIVGTNVSVIDTAEQKLGKEVSEIEIKAQSISIKTAEEFAYAAEVTKRVKEMQNSVTDYWEPLRKSTYDAYQKVLTQKKEMLDPLASAEKILKNKMKTYTVEEERKRRALEDAMRRQAQEEIEKKIDEAAKAESNGDIEGYEFAMAQAEVMESVATVGSVAAPAPKVKGVSQSKKWRIIAIDKHKVPVSFQGMELRPVDEKLVMQLIKTSKGKIVIPGITYDEDVTISVRV